MRNSRPSGGLDAPSGVGALDPKAVRAAISRAAECGPTSHAEAPRSEDIAGGHAPALESCAVAGKAPARKKTTAHKIAAPTVVRRPVMKLLLPERNNAAPNRRFFCIATPGEASCSDGTNSPHYTQEASAMITPEIASGYLTGQLLVAMPQMGDPRFERTVIYICAHTAEGAMGLVVNRALENVRLPDLLRQLSIPDLGHTDAIQVHFGGPVESGQGFILHSADYVQDATLMVGGGVGLTATLDILK